MPPRPTLRDNRPIILSRQAFRQYLKSCADSIAGQKSNACECPIARYLKQEFQNTISEINVDDIEITYQDRDIYQGNISVPPWAQSFIQQIDEAAEPLTGYNCLAILDFIDPTDDTIGDLIDPTE